MKINIFTLILSILIILLSIKIYSDSDFANLKCIISHLDGNTYCVRERNKLELAADKLAKVNMNLKKLLDYCNIQLAFCLNNKKNGNKLIDMNTLMYVALHEISHIATKSVGHTDEFWQNFKFFIEQAAVINIYKPIDYKKTPAQYCGMDITDNPYFDIE